jgi:hypothetical protein
VTWDNSIAGILRLGFGVEHQAARFARIKAEFAKPVRPDSRRDAAGCPQGNGEERRHSGGDALPEALQHFIAAEIARWGAVVRQAGRRFSSLIGCLGSGLND